jgi:hypothetical protein
MFNVLKKSQCDRVVTSRYIQGRKIEDWIIKQKLLSKIATKIDKKFLNIDAKYPISRFFAFSVIF